jgi:hypothetical protein
MTVILYAVYKLKRVMRQSYPSAHWNLPPGQTVVVTLCQIAGDVTRVISFSHVCSETLHTDPCGQQCWLSEQQTASVLIDETVAEVIRK